MGANLHIVNRPHCTRGDLEVWYRHEVEAARFQYGNDAYSGTWASKHGLAFPVAAVFDSEQQAHDYIGDHNEKWGPSYAVVFRQRVFTPADKARQDTLGKRAQQVDSLLHCDLNQEILDRVMKAKSDHRGCTNCGSRIAVRKMVVRSINCPVCRHPFLATKGDLEKRERLTAEATQVRQALAQMHVCKGDAHHVLLWAVGGWCPS